MANKTIKEEKEIIKEESVVEEKKELSQEESRSKKFWKPIGNFFKTNVIFTIVIMMAIVSMIFVPIDKEYGGYFEWSTVAFVFLILLVVAGLENINFFDKVARFIVKRVKNTRSIIICLIFMTYVSAIFNANDMALLTLLPLSYIVLKYTNNLRYCAFTFIMQNIASNLGGMVVPIGNPQNLFIYSFYEVPLWEFLKIMFLPTLFAFILIIICCLFIKKNPIRFEDDNDHKINKKATIILLSLFMFVLLGIFRVLPWWIALIVVPIVMIFIDRKAFKGVDYTIPLTFVIFFIFSGNMSRIPAITELLTNVVNDYTYVSAYISCQLISNVPTAILFSKFTANYPALLVSVNVASLGIIFSSLSGIIAMKEYIKVSQKEKFGRKRGAWYYIGMDTLFNVVGALILAPLSYFSLFWIGM